MKKILLIYAIIFFTIFFTNSVFANQAEYLNKLSEKKQASFNDLVYTFCYMLQKDPSSDNIQVNLSLIKDRIKYLPKKYSADKPLTIGDFSLFTMQYLNIKSGIFYMASKSGRYAVRELSLIGIVPYNTSEWENMSGMELINLLQKVGEYVENRNKK